MRTPGDSALTPRQLEVLDGLLAIGASRPLARAELPQELSSRISAAVSPALERWTERSFFLSKSAFLDHVRCEGLALARSLERGSPPTGALLRGQVAHRAIQICYTHPHQSPDAAVRSALAAVCASDAAAQSWWDAASSADQSDLLVSAVSTLTNFLDDFPPLDPAWTPRFEEPISARVGRLRFSVRADLALGRPRGDSRQTMLLVDFKSGSLSDSHEHEAMFYALVATLRHGVPPWRSVVFSLADGAFTPPDVSEERLISTADMVASAAARQVALMMEETEASLSPGTHCRFCPARDVCAAAES